MAFKKKIKQLCMVSVIVLGFVAILGSGGGDDGGDDSPVDKPSAVPTTVGPMGGTIEAENIHLIIPEGALKSDQQITIKNVADIDIVNDIYGDYDIASSVYEFGPSGLSFKSPIKVRIPLVDGNDIEDIAIYWSSIDQRNKFEKLETHIEEGYAVAETTHFSRGFLASAVWQYCQNIGITSGLRGEPCCLGNCYRSIPKQLNKDGTIGYTSSRLECNSDTDTCEYECLKLGEDGCSTSEDICKTELSNHSYPHQYVCKGQKVTDPCAGCRDQATKGDTECVLNEYSVYECKTKILWYTDRDGDGFGNAFGVPQKGYNAPDDVTGPNGTIVKYVSNDGDECDSDASKTSICCASYDHDQCIMEDNNCEFNFLNNKCQDKTECNPHCDSYSVNQCVKENCCTDAGGEWSNDECVEEYGCDPLVRNSCKNYEACKKAGGEWAWNVCYGGYPTQCEFILDGGQLCSENAWNCLSEECCTTRGNGQWRSNIDENGIDNGRCTPNCAPNDLFNCRNEEDCTTIGNGYWSTALGQCKEPGMIDEVNCLSYDDKCWSFNAEEGCLPCKNQCRYVAWACSTEEVCKSMYGDGRWGTIAINGSELTEKCKPDPFNNIEEGNMEEICTGDKIDAEWCEF